MTSTQLPLNSQLLSQTTLKSTKNNSRNSMKADFSEKITKKRLTKTRQRKRKIQSKSDSDSGSSSGSETNQKPVKVQPKRKKRRTKKKSTESTHESLATLGRAYGNTVSKQNVSKVSEQPQPIPKSGQGVSKAATSREYGEFSTCKTGLTYLETNRIDVINSKGIKSFTDDYMKKLKKCEAYEQGHNVEPFASVRLKLLNEGLNNFRSLQDVDRYSRVKTEEKKTVANASLTETKNITTAALKTIEIIKKFKSGQSIAADLQVRKKAETVPTNTKNVRRQSVIKSESDEKRSTSKENENSAKANGKQIVSPLKTTDDKTVATRKPEELQIAENKSLETFITVPKSAKKVGERMRTIKERPSEESLSIGSIPSTEYLKLSDPKDNPAGNSTQPHGYVLMKKVLMSSEKSVTIVDGKNRYDTKNRSVTSHFAGRLPPKTASADKETDLKSIETLYRTDGAIYTPKNNRRSTDARKSLN